LKEDNFFVLQKQFKMNDILIAPSILAADFGNLKRDIEIINNSEADWFHIDIMDGMFVPNISFGMPVLKAIKKYANKPLDVHLMIEDPDRYIEDFVDLGADIITVHYEACKHLHRTIQLIHSFGVKAGVALNPHTNVKLLGNMLSDIDIVCIMSVNPGFGGQDFIENTYNKVKALREFSKDKNPNLYIEIDGGVSVKNAKLLSEAGANVLVAGSSVFKTEDPAAAVEGLKEAIM